VEVLLRPPLGGCLMVLVSVVTLGVYPLLRPLLERHFIARMDDEGFETRSGKRVSWSEVERIKHVIGEMKGAKLSDEYAVWSPQGRSSLPVWRAQDPKGALDYLIQRAPQHAWLKDT
jgi:hypothetical protein